MCTAVCNRRKFRLHFVKWSGSDTKQPNVQPVVSQQKTVVDEKQTECCQRKGGDGMRQLNKNLLRNTVKGCCEYGNELSDPTKGDYQFHVKDSCPRSEVEKRTEATSVHVSFHLEQCFSTAGPRPGKFFFHKTRARSQQIYSLVPFQFFLSSCIKLTQVLIINYGVIIKSISTIMCTVWHVDKYKITFKLVINSRRISRGPV